MQFYSKLLVQARRIIANNRGYLVAQDIMALVYDVSWLAITKTPLKVDNLRDKLAIAKTSSKVDNLRHRLANVKTQPKVDNSQHRQVSVSRSLAKSL